MKILICNDVDIFDYTTNQKVGVRCADIVEVPFPVASPWEWIDFPEGTPTNVYWTGSSFVELSAVNYPQPEPKPGQPKVSGVTEL
jgi:hypothetical protein